MYYVYIVKSINQNYFYVGFTKDVQKRVEAHNSGKTEKAICKERQIKAQRKLKEHIISSLNLAPSSSG